MLGLTRKTDIALLALAYLGQRRDTAEPAASARAIASAFGLPLPQLMNILKELARARLIRSTRGAQGGYELDLEPARISLAEVVTAMEGPFRFARCAQGLPVLGQGCRVGSDCPISHPIRRLHQRMQQFLDDVSLADLLESEVDVPLAALGAG